KEGRQPEKTDGFPQSINHLIEIYELWNEQQKVRLEFERRQLELFLGKKIIKQEFNQLASRVYCNALFIAGPNTDALGPGIYLKASLINNSCDFNSITVYDGTTLSVRATRPIIKGQELTISYVSPLQPSNIRRKMLQEKYGFNCTCPRCENKELDAKMQSIVCEKCKGQVLRKQYMTFMKCSVCDQLPSQKHVSAILAIETESIIFVEETIKLQPISDRQSAYALDLSRRQKCFLHRLHYLRAKTFDRVGHILMNMNNFKDGIPMLEEVILTYESLYPPYQPLIGIHCKRLAVVYMQVLRFEEARKRLIQALAALKITHGEGHPFYRETSKTLQGVIWALS
ncbi:histone-lysine N-methyltransferase ASHR1-like, partial [Anneissia japonica]|uniref:histone-lysine N-methyltransferase ASHR1-like n=1 Tax=Anneissia japonica TaxID=1529436 RepID=UPI00142578BF